MKVSSSYSDSNTFQELLVCLFRASEKAASIARACRAEEALFQLLVEEKTGEDKNAKFDQDFKTLADVLIQETVRHDVSKSFPALRDNIMGEESNKFTNKLGESLTVEVKETVEATTELLVKVLDNNEVAAKLLAKHVHAEVTVEETEISGLSGLLECDPEELAVWIDPIDATSQYIQGGEDGQEVPTQGLQVTPTLLSKLQVVTVLLGAFLRSSGTPVLGLVNQPFGGPGQRLHWAVAASQGGSLPPHQVQEAGATPPPSLRTQCPALPRASSWDHLSLQPYWKPSPRSMRL